MKYKLDYNGTVVETDNVKDLKAIVNALSGGAIDETIKRKEYSFHRPTNAEFREKLKEIKDDIRNTDISRQDIIKKYRISTNSLKKYCKNDFRQRVKKAFDKTKTRKRAYSKSPFNRNERKRAGLSTEKKVFPTKVADKAVLERVGEAIRNGELTYKNDGKFFGFDLRRNPPTEWINLIGTIAKYVADERLVKPTLDMTEMSIKFKRGIG